MTINSGFSHWKWWFSIAMLNYQRVSLFFYRGTKSPPSRRCWWRPWRRSTSPRSWHVGRGSPCPSWPRGRRRRFPGPVAGGGSGKRWKVTMGYLFERDIEWKDFVFRNVESGLMWMFHLRMFQGVLRMCRNFLIWVLCCNVCEFWSQHFLGQSLVFQTSGLRW